MEKIKFSVLINASKEKVWKVLWGDDTYPQWTEPFGSSGKAVSDWKVGSKILFLAENGDGMVARIAATEKNEFMSFEHLGMIADGVEDTTSDKVKPFVGAHENYRLTESDGKTSLDIEMDTTSDFISYFEESWPRALQVIKKIAE